MTHRARPLAATLLAAVLCLGLLVPMLSVTASPRGGTDGDEAFIRKLMKGMTLEEKVGQMFMTYAYGQSADDPDSAMVAANQDAYGWTTSNSSSTNTISAASSTSPGPTT